MVAGIYQYCIEEELDEEERGGGGREEEEENKRKMNEERDGREGEMIGGIGMRRRRI